MAKTNRSRQAWHPLVLWQLLRRNRVYQLSYKEVLAWTDEVGNPYLRNEIDDLYKNCIRHFDEIENSKFSEFDLDGHARLSQERYGYPLDETNICLGNFYLNMGDIIKFPIPYDIPYPSFEFLSSVWVLRPASLTTFENGLAKNLRKNINDIERLGYYDKFRLPDLTHPNERVLTLCLEINTLFTDATISDSVSSVLDSFLKEIRQKHPPVQPLYGFKPRWLDLLMYFEAWDLFELDSQDVSHFEVGKAFVPKGTKEQKVQFGRNVKSYIPQLIEYFDIFIKRRREVLIHPIAKEVS